MQKALIKGITENATEVAKNLLSRSASLPAEGAAASGEEMERSKSSHLEDRISDREASSTVTIKQELLDDAQELPDDQGDDNSIYDRDKYDKHYKHKKGRQNKD